MIRSAAPPCRGFECLRTARNASGSAVLQDVAIGSPAPNADRRRLAVALATAGGAGYAPVAPGTAGAAVGAGLYWLIAPTGFAIVVATAVGLCVLGVFAADGAERAFGKRDDGRIVIDEVVGQLVTLAPLPLLAGDARNLWLVTAGFLVFRLFDIWKPGPVRWAEHHFDGGAGVMFDDVLAGLLGAGCMALLAAFTGGAA
jgi:phosphatidylglycerophosphatase A